MLDKVETQVTWLYNYAGHMSPRVSASCTKHGCGVPACTKHISGVVMKLNYGL